MFNPPIEKFRVMNQDPSRAETQLQQLITQLQRQQSLIATDDPKIARHKFTPDEDEHLRSLVAEMGQSDWNAIALHFHKRTARQCRERWRHYISPAVRIGSWSEADDQLLLSKVSELGPRWSAISNLFPGRTDIGVKNHYISLVGKKVKEPALAEQVTPAPEPVLSLPSALLGHGPAGPPPPLPSLPETLPERRRRNR
jgi:hypothetical protein